LPNCHQVTRYYIPDSNFSSHPRESFKLSLQNFELTWFVCSGYALANYGWNRYDYSTGAMAVTISQVTPDRCNADEVHNQQVMHNHAVTRYNSWWSHQTD